MNKTNHLSKDLLPGQNVAVIGSGISGLATAWFLSQSHKVTVFEKNAKLGGHTNTVNVDIDEIGRASCRERV